MKMREKWSTRCIEREKMQRMLKKKPKWLRLKEAIQSDFDGNKNCLGNVKIRLNKKTPVDWITLKMKWCNDVWWICKAILEGVYFNKNYNLCHEQIWNECYIC